MNNISTKNDEARPEVDAVLGEFFKAEMPQPWPTFKAPLETRVKEQPTFWSRSSGRFALAASIALLVGGYLTLGGFFPRSQVGTGLQHAAPDSARGIEKLKTNKQLEQPQPRKVEQLPQQIGTVPMP